MNKKRQILVAGMGISPAVLTNFEDYNCNHEK